MCILIKRRTDIADNKEKENVKKHEAQRSFFATVVHDLKTPIVAQLRSIDLVLNGKLGSVNTKQEEILRLTEDSCKYTLKLVTTILDSYKVDCQKLNLKKEFFDMKDLINSCLEETNMLAEEKYQNFILKITSDESKVYADYLQIKRVIINLLLLTINKITIVRNSISITKVKKYPMKICQKCSINSLKPNCQNIIPSALDSVSICQNKS